MTSRDKLIKHYFDEFILSNNLIEIQKSFDNLCYAIDINPVDDHINFYRNFRNKIKFYWKAQTLFNKLDKKFNQKEYKRQTACNDINTLVVGSGPCGLRCAIELALLGAKVIIVEKRQSFSRNNVLHLWPYVISDLNQLGAKKFFGLFCSGSINHISIKRLQCILMKISLVFGVQIYHDVDFEGLEPPKDQLNNQLTGEGDVADKLSVNSKKWTAKISPHNHIVRNYQFDVVIGANGRSNILNFKRKQLRCRLAIAITVNFVNHNTAEEAQVEEISGIVFIFNQDYFKSLYQRTGIDLENIVYYKDETHYFVMTVKKHCLLTKQVLKQDFDNVEMLLASDNIDQIQLQNFAREAAMAATNYRLNNLEFSMNYKQQPDIAVFDFTHLSAAENASRIIERNNKPLVQALIGDSLLEPFWPTGSGCALGFLSALDTAWLIRRLGIIQAAVREGKLQQNKTIIMMLEALAERENIYQRLSQITAKNMPPDFQSYTVNPKTRYTQCRSKSVGLPQILHLYDTDQFIVKNQLKSLFDSECSETYLENFNPQIDFQKSTNDFQLREKLLRWYQINLSQINQWNEQFSNLSSVLYADSSRALIYLLHLYKPESINLVSLPSQSSSDNLNKMFAVMKEEFQLEFPNDIISDAIDNRLNDKEVLDILNKIYQIFKLINPEPSESPLDKKSYHYNPRRLASKRQLLSPLPVLPSLLLSDAKRLNTSPSVTMTNNNNTQSQQQPIFNLDDHLVNEKLNHHNIRQIDRIKAIRREIIDKYTGKQHLAVDMTTNTTGGGSNSYGLGKLPAHKSISTGRISQLTEKIFTGAVTTPTANANTMTPPIDCAIPSGAVSSSNTTSASLHNSKLTSAKNSRYINTVSMEMLSDDNCYFCRKKVSLDQKRNLHNSKKCFCKDCCIELKLDAWSSQDGHNNTVANAATAVVTSATSASQSNQALSIDVLADKDYTKLPLESINQYLRKSLLDLRRINDESDEDYDGSSERSTNQITDTNQLDGLFHWPNELCNPTELCMKSRSQGVIARHKRRQRKLTLPIVPNVDVEQQRAVNPSSNNHNNSPPSPCSSSKVSSSSTSSCDELNMTNRLLLCNKQMFRNNLYNISSDMKQRNDNIENIEKIYPEKNANNVVNSDQQSEDREKTLEPNHHQQSPITEDHQQQQSRLINKQHLYLDLQSVSNINHKSSAAGTNSKSLTDIQHLTSTQPPPVAAATHKDGLLVVGTPNPSTDYPTTTHLSYQSQTIDRKHTNSTSSNLTTASVTPSIAGTSTVGNNYGQQRHLAKFKFCSEPPKPVSINPKDFIGQMNAKKLQLVDIQCFYDSAELIEPYENQILNCNKPTDDAIDNVSALHNKHNNKYIVRQVEVASIASSVKTPVVTPVTPTVLINRKSINSSKANVIAAPTNPYSTNVQYPSHKHTLNLDEFKDIDSISMCTEEDPNFTRVIQATTNKDNNNNNRTEHRQIKVKATLESDLEEEEEVEAVDAITTSHQLESIINNNLVASSHRNNETSCSSDNEMSLGEASMHELVTTDEPSICDGLDQLHNNKAQQHVTGTEGKSSVLLRPYSGSTGLRDSFKRRRKSDRYISSTGKSKQKCPDSQSVILMSSPPNEFEMKDTQMKCVDSLSIHTHPIKSNDLMVAKDTSSSICYRSFTSMNELYKKLDNIEDSLDQLEL